MKWLVGRYVDDPKSVRKRIITDLKFETVLEDFVLKLKR